MNIAPGRSGNKLTGGLSAHPSAAACGARWEGNKRTEPTGMTTDNRRIYVDLDDVLCETAEAARDIARRRFGRSVDFSHIHSFDLGTSFGLSTVEADGLMGELNDPSVLADLAPRAGAPECLRAWSDAGYAVFVVTGRPPLVQPATKQWLAARRVPYDELLFTDIDLEEEPESYSDLDLTLFLSVGYFVIDRVEVGVSGSALTTWYYETDQSDFGVYDARAHVRYFFDNPSVLTPYVKLQGGTTWIDSGSYEEVHDSGAVVLGLEVFGMGSMTWFVELSSEYTELGGDLSGSEWRNQLYIGVTWYLNLNRKREKTAAGQ